MNNKQVDDFVLGQTDRNRVIIGHLREILMNSAPGMREEWKFKSHPFYVLNKWVAFISVKNVQVQLGFCEGVHLKDGLKKLERKELKQVRYLSINEWNTEMEDVIRYYLQMAIDVDLKFSKKKT